jgi:anti-sigma regulatory factor (Ser/Thr protein kinase)
LDVSASFPGTPGGAVAARHFVRDALTASDGELRDTVVLLTSEVVTNAALHTGADFEVEITTLDGGDVRVWVTDLSPEQLPQVRPAPVDATGGRGLHVVDALASAWGVDYQPHGKIVWFEVRPGQTGT